MTLLRPFTVVLTLTLSGCGGDAPETPGAAPTEAEKAASIEKVKAAYAELGADPGKVYQQEILDIDLETGEARAKRLALVPSPDGKAFHVVDSNGEIFNDHYDFLRDTTIGER